MEDVYHILERPAWVELKVKGSRFIAEALPVESDGEAGAAIAAVRKREYGATHHCTAYRAGPEGHLCRYDDAGEPGGTAGLPILRQIDARALTNTLVVVTRYFGGTKLGTGGLARAYGDAAAEALEAAGRQTCILRERLRLSFAYADTSPAIHTLTRFDALILDTRYAEGTELVVGVRRSQAAAFIEAFTNALGGRGLVEEREDEGKSG